MPPRRELTTRGSGKDPETSRQTLECRSVNGGMGTACSRRGCVRPGDWEAPGTVAMRCGPSVWFPATPSILSEGWSFPCSGDGSHRAQVLENSRDLLTYSEPPSPVKTSGSHRCAQPQPQEAPVLGGSPGPWGTDRGPRNASFCPQFRTCHVTARPLTGRGFAALGTNCKDSRSQRRAAYGD